MPMLIHLRKQIQQDHSWILYIWFLLQVQLGDNRIVFEDLPTYIGGLYVAN